MTNSVIQGVSHSITSSTDSESGMVGEPVRLLSEIE